MSVAVRAWVWCCMFFAAGVFLPARLGAQTQTGPRVAVVIGNADYATAPLSNPGHDARAISAVLKDHGFTVVEAFDASKAQMERAIAQARDALDGKRGIAMLYYAGHALQLEWRNYLVPVDAVLRTGRDVPRQTVDLQQVLDAFKAAGTSMNIIVLDACRDNPFGATGRGAGLAPIDAPWGSFLAYATAPGNLAEDGSDGAKNSLYTRHLVEELKRPGSRIEDVFKRVRLQVRQRTDGRQIPWESTSLEDEFYFDATHRQPKKPAEDRKEQEVELAAWNAIKASVKALDFSEFLLRYPNGPYSELAQFRLDRLQEQKVVASPRKDGLQTPKPGSWRYQKGDMFVYERHESFVGKQQLPTTTLVVTDATAELVTINEGASLRDQMGTILKFGDVLLQPGNVVAPADIAVGKKWRSRYQRVNAESGRWLSDTAMDYQAVALEKVTVPAGTFTAYRVEATGLENAGGADQWRLKRTYWIDAEMLVPVREEIASRRVTGRAAGTNEIRELVKVARVR